jgi:hypothetical protein
MCSSIGREDYGVRIPTISVKRKVATRRGLDYGFGCRPVRDEVCFSSFKEQCPVDEFNEITITVSINVCDFYLVHLGGHGTRERANDIRCEQNSLRVIFPASPATGSLLQRHCAEAESSGDDLDSPI